MGWRMACTDTAVMGPARESGVEKGVLRWLSGRRRRSWWMRWKWTRTVTMAATMELLTIDLVAIG